MTQHLGPIEGTIGTYTAPAITVTNATAKVCPKTVAPFVVFSASVSGAYSQIRLGDSATCAQTNTSSPQGAEFNCSNLSIATHYYTVYADFGDGDHQCAVSAPAEVVVADKPCCLTRTAGYWSTHGDEVAWVIGQKANKTDGLMLWGKHFYPDAVTGYDPNGDRTPGRRLFAAPKKVTPPPKKVKPPPPPPKKVKPPPPPPKKVKPPPPPPKKVAPPPPKKGTAKTAAGVTLLSTEPYALACDGVRPDAVRALCATGTVTKTGTSACNYAKLGRQCMAARLNILISQACDLGPSCWEVSWPLYFQERLKGGGREVRAQTYLNIYEPNTSAATPLKTQSGSLLETQLFTTCCSATGKPPQTATEMATCLDAIDDFNQDKTDVQKSCNFVPRGGAATTNKLCTDYNTAFSSRTASACDKGFCYNPYFGSSLRRRLMMTEAGGEW